MTKLKGLKGEYIIGYFNFTIKIIGDHVFRIPGFQVENISIIKEIEGGNLLALKKLKKAYVEYLQNELAREDLK